MLLEFFKPGFGGTLALGPFKAEGLGHNAHGKSAHFLGSLRNHGGRASAGAAAHARGNKNHVGIADGFTNAAHAFHSGLAANGGVGTSAKTLGKLFAQLHLNGSAAFVQRLNVGVGTNKLHAAQARCNHVLHSVTAAATYANNLDLGIAGQRGIDIINDRLSHYTSPLCYPQMPA